MSTSSINQQFDHLTETLSREHLILIERVKSEVCSICEREEERLRKERERVEEEGKRVEEEGRKVEEKVRKWEEMSAKLEKTHVPSVVQLNVGMLCLLFVVVCFLKLLPLVVLFVCLFVG